MDPPICTPQSPNLLAHCWVALCGVAQVSAQQRAITWGLIMFYISHRSSFLVGNAGDQIHFGVRQTIIPILSRCRLIYRPLSPLHSPTSPGCKYLRCPGMTRVCQPMVPSECARGGRAYLAPRGSGNAMELCHAMHAQAMAMNADTDRTLIENVRDRVHPQLMAKTTASILLVSLDNRRCGPFPLTPKNRSRRVIVDFWRYHPRDIWGATPQKRFQDFWVSSSKLKSFHGCSHLRGTWKSEKWHLAELKGPSVL